jgi:AAA family ATP:ADP antiporter
VLDTLLRAFSDVKPGEGLAVTLLALDLFLLLVGYYVVKTVREPLILGTGGAELKAYASGVQAIVLMGAVPLYRALANRLRRDRLVLGVSGLFVACLVAFWVPARQVLGGDGAPVAADFEVDAADFFTLGYVFYVWVGIFSLTMIAQFWSVANDLYRRVDGERLFPIVALGATLGAVSGSAAASLFFRVGLSVANMLLVSAAFVVMHAVILIAASRLARQESTSIPSDAPLEGPSGISLVLASPYLRLVALMLLLLNLVNTSGEYLLDRLLTAEAQARLAAGTITDARAYIGAFKGDFFLGVNIATVAIQALLTSRIVRYAGIRGALLVLPVVAFGAYAMLGAGVGLALFRWAKTAENATDYSVMNTAKAMLWLPTSRDEKYKAKQLLDTFFVRFGDVAAAGLIALCVYVLQFSVRELALVNVSIACLWAACALLVARRYSAGGAAISGAGGGAR